MIDLDEIERQLEDRQGVSATDVLDVLAELRAAREVVEAARKLTHNMNWITETEDAETIARSLEEAVRAYDKTVGAS